MSKVEGIRSILKRRKQSANELLRHRDMLMEAARKQVDPENLGLRPVMDTDDTDFFGTDDNIAFRDWWDWVTQVIKSLSDGLTRISLAVATGTLALAASHLYQTDRGATYATPVLGASGVFAAVLLVSSLVASMRKR